MDFEIHGNKAMLPPTSSTDIISELPPKIDSFINALVQLKEEAMVMDGPESLLSLESKAHAIARETADHIVALQLQRQLNRAEHKTCEHELIRDSGHRMKDMGKRVITITFAGGTKLSIEASYYHRKATLRKHKGKAGYYPGLMLLGISDKLTPALQSNITMMAAACNSLEESCQLQKTLLGLSLYPKQVSRISKRFAFYARSAIDADKLELGEDLSGRKVAISIDGGRVRIRRNKRGPKTKKHRHRYHTDWKEPKLFILYVIDENGRMSRTLQPFIEASMQGPDHIFGLLIHYLKKLKIQLADKLLFISDGATWIWDRAKQLASALGLATTQCLLVLDYYHAVEHLNVIALKKPHWSSKKRKTWLHKQKAHLLEGRLDAFMLALDQACLGTGDDILLRERRYFKKHMQHLDYHKMKANNLPIGSGAVESAIRRVINLRLKGAGIFWHEDSAEAMLMLRSFYKAGRWSLLKNMAYIGGLPM